MENTINNNKLPEPFVHELLGCQDRLYTYLTPMLRNRSEVDEVLQETNLAICRQVNEFSEIKNFTAWACRIAYYRVLAFRKKQARDRHVFSEETLRLIADESQDQISIFSKELTMLEKCFEKLTPHQQYITKKRYQSNTSLQCLAEELGRSPNTISQILCRIRASLLRCILRSMNSINANNL